MDIISFVIFKVVLFLYAIYIVIKLSSSGIPLVFSGNLSVK